MCSVFEQANIVRGKCDRGSLFPASEKSAAIDLFNISQSIDQTPFYSRVAAFQVRKLPFFEWKQKKYQSV